MGSQKKKILWIVNIVLISIALLVTVFADELSDVSTQLRGYTSYVYPDAGKEHILGPEKPFTMRYIMMVLVKQSMEKL